MLAMLSSTMGISGHGMFIPNAEPTVFANNTAYPINLHEAGMYSVIPDLRTCLHEASNAKI